MAFVLQPSNCFVNAPFADLHGGLIELFCRHHLQPEIGLEGDVLYDYSRRDFELIAKRLTSNGLRCTLHAPFFDLSPGALDRTIRQASREKLKKAFLLAEIFQPQLIVCHLNFEENKHGYKRDAWFGHAQETWSQLIRLAKNLGTQVVLENTYETHPAEHRRMLEALSFDNVGFCLDIGHTHAFAGNSWRDWLPEMLPWLRHLHLHDNDGSRDQHKAVGSGIADIKGLLDYLDGQKQHPTVTLEPHSEEDLWQSLEALKAMQILQ